MGSFIRNNPRDVRGRRQGALSRMLYHVRFIAYVEMNPDPLLLP